MPADSDDQGTIVGVNVNPLDLEPFMCGGKRNPLDVRRERDAIDTERCAQASKPNASIFSGVIRTVMRVSSGLRHG